MFGEYLRSKRKEKGLTLKQLAELSGLSDAYICHVENGKRGIPSTENVNKLAQALGIDLFEMMGKTGKFMSYRNFVEKMGGIVGKRILPDGTVVLTKTATVELTNIHNLDVTYKGRKITKQESQRLKYALPLIFPQD